MCILSSQRDLDPSPQPGALVFSVVVHTRNPRCLVLTGAIMYPVCVLTHEMEFVVTEPRVVRGWLPPWCSLACPKPAEIAFPLHRHFLYHLGVISCQETRLMAPVYRAF